MQSDFMKSQAKILREDLYIKSNRETCVSLNKFSKCWFPKLLSCGDSVSERQRVSQDFCDYLCTKFDIPPVTVVVLNKPQPHSNTDTGKTRSKTLGTYAVGREVITMYNLTAKQHKAVAIKTFIGTLIHEFIHHYDIFKLGLPTSYHTKGFYMRVSDLDKKLKSIS